MTGQSTAVNLAVTRLSVDYPAPDGGRLVVIEDLSFTAGPGDFVCLAGRSGSGKTSVLRQLVGLTPPASGTVAWAGRDVSAMSESERADLRRTAVAYLDQEASLLEDLTCLDNAVLSCLPDGRAAARAARARARSALGDLGLAKRLRWRPRQLSGGERQRAVLARALTSRATGLVADEPTASLDRTWADHVTRRLRAVADDGGLVVVSSHDPGVAAAADHVILLD